MPLHLGPAYRKAIEIYAEVVGQPGRSLRFSSALVLPYLALSPIVLPEQRLGAAGPGMMALAVVQFVLMFCVSIVLAIRWHRYVLLGEDVARFLTVPFGRRELRYFGRSLLVGIVTMAVMISTVVPFGILVGMVLANGGFAGAIAPLLLAGVAYLLGILVIARLGLVFPAVAIDREAKLAASWRATRAHWWPFFLLLVLVGLPQILVVMAIETVLDQSSSTIWSAIAVLVQEIAFLAGVAAFAIALSSNYLAAARNAGDAADEPVRD